MALEIENRLRSPTSFHIAGARLPECGRTGCLSSPGKAIAPRRGRGSCLAARDAGFFTFGSLRPSLTKRPPSRNGRGLGGVLIVADPKDPQVDADIDARPQGLARRAFRRDGGELRRCLAARGPRSARQCLHHRRPRREASHRAASGRALPRAHRQSVQCPPCAAEIRRAASDLDRRLGAAIGDLRTPLHGEMLISSRRGASIFVCDIPKDARPPAEPQIRALIGNGFPLLGVALSGDPIQDEPAPLGWLSDNALPEFIDLRHAMRIDCEVTLPRRSEEPRRCWPPRDPARLWAIDGKSGDLGKPPLFSAKRGTPVVIAISNKSDVPIVMKLNGHVARLLHPRDDGWVPAGSMSCVGSRRTSAERIAFVADNPDDAGCSAAASSSISPAGSSAGSRWCERQGRYRLKRKRLSDRPMVSGLEADAAGPRPCDLYSRLYKMRGMGP